MQRALRFLVIVILAAAPAEAQTVSYRQLDTVNFKERLLGNDWGNTLKHYGAVVDPERHVAYISNPQVEYIARIDTQTLTELPPVRAQFRGHLSVLRVVPSNGYLLITDTEADFPVAYLTNPETSEVIGQYEYPTDGTGAVDIDPGTNRLFMAEGAIIKVRNGDTFAEMDEIVAGYSVGGLAFDPGENVLYVGARNANGGEVRVRVLSAAAPYSQVRSFSVPSEVPLGNVIVDTATDRMILLGQRHFEIVRLSDGAPIRSELLPTIALTSYYDPVSAAIYFLSQKYFDDEGLHGDWGRVYRYFMESAALDSTRFGLYPQNMTLDVASRRLVLPNMHSGWIDFVDLDNWPSKDSVDVAVSADYIALAPDGRTAYIAERLGGSRVIAYDLETRAAREIEAGSWPSVVHVDADIDRMYVLNHYETSISVFDTDTEMLLGTIRFSDLNEGRTDAIASMTFDPSTHRIYAAFPELERVIVADGLAIEPVGSFLVDRYTFDEENHKAVGVLQVAVSSDGPFLAVGDLINRRVYLYEKESFEFVRAVEFSGQWPNENNPLRAEMLHYDALAGAFWLGNMQVPIAPPFLPEAKLPPVHRWLGNNEANGRTYAAHISGDSLYIRAFDTSDLTLLESNYVTLDASSNPNFHYDAARNELFAASFRYGTMARWDLDVVEAGAPTATPDAFATSEDVSLTVDAGVGLLANDTDPNGDSLTAQEVTGPLHGSLTLEADGGFTFLPEPNFNGEDAFSYRATDGGSPSEPVSVTLTVTAVNDAPTASADEYETAEDTALAPVESVLANDDDVDEDALTATLVTPAAHGTLALETDGTFTYTPSADFAGVDTFTYQATDGSLAADSATVSITVTQVNDAPVAVALEATTIENEAVSIPLEATDVDSDQLEFVITREPAHGSVILAEGVALYTPEPGFNGEDSFAYVADDGALQSEAAEVTVVVSEGNVAPLAVEDAYASPEDILLVVVAGDGVLANDVDPNGDNLSAELVRDADHGEVTLAADGSFSYAPDANYNGTDGFRYQASDGAASSDEVAVSLTVSAVNDPPVAPPITEPADGTELTLSGDPAARVTVRWSAGQDVDGDPLSYTWLLARTPQFRDTLMVVEAGAALQAEVAAGELAGLLSAFGVPPGGSMRVTHRVVASDDSVHAPGPVFGLNLIRGAFTGSESQSELPREVTLLSNYPNPFNPVTRLAFGLPEASEVRLAVFDMLGREVTGLVSGMQPAGWHEVSFDGSGLGTGIYIQVLEVGPLRISRPMTLLR